MAVVLGGLLAGLGGMAAAGAAGAGIWKAAERRAERRWRAALDRERAAGAHLCGSTIESLAAALEAGDPYNAGNLECVLRVTTAMARALRLPEDEAAGLRAAAMLHNVGRLGVPDHLLHKTDDLTPYEQEKLRSHPVLGARILASIPFPWPVVPIVRHQSEHWDGHGYPDGISGEAIPRGARILAIAAAYSALQRDRPFREPFAPAEALDEIERRAGSQFDPKMVAAFREIAAEMRLEDGVAYRPEDPPLAVSGSSGQARARDEARSALEDIAAAQRETLALYALSQAVTGSLHLDQVCNTVVNSAAGILRCAACAVFLPEEDGEYLRAHAAVGANQRHLLGSLARIGTYVTGRAFSRGEVRRVSFMADDLILRDVSDTWHPFRSTLAVPLEANGEVIGVLNLYAEAGNAFDVDAQRVMRLLASQAGRAIDGARRFAAVRETAYTDALTGLRNGRYLREYLDRELNRASRDGSSLAVLNIDLDNFKPVNDRFGHARGDQTLQEIAEILKAHVRNYDLAARYAGDEFVLVLVRTKRPVAETTAAKLKAAVERYGQRVAAREPDFPTIGLSVGIAIYPESGHDIQTLLCASDANMYSDKSARKAGRIAA
ncbi:MAG TPA: diguanylate cyclase [Chthonomonadaceae bacterium]|nr:diguanylate cyclase [Chthonomonadaceae bacterium]